jgi:hypothetical protein
VDRAKAALRVDQKRHLTETLTIIAEVKQLVI